MQGTRGDLDSRNCHRRPERSEAQSRDLPEDWQTRWIPAASPSIERTPPIHSPSLEPRCFPPLVRPALDSARATCLSPPTALPTRSPILVASGPPYYVYVLSNAHRTVLYVGVTNDLQRRLQQHREGRADAFTTKYNAIDLVYFERHATSTAAIEREKQLKAWRRSKKETLIRSENPDLEALPPPVD